MARTGALAVTLLSLTTACKPRTQDAEAGVDASEATRLLLPPAAAVPDAALDPAATLARGKLLYDRYCDFCHGTEGQGYAADEAPALANPAFQALASDDFLREAIVKGRPGTTMSAWSVARGGPLAYADASAIVAYLRSWQVALDGGGAPAASVALVTSDGQAPDAQAPDGGAGSAARGAVTYAAHCATCHGAKGRDGKHNALANPELLLAASDQFLAATIEGGRPGTPMKGFKGKLSPSAIEDVVALLRSWQRPPEEAAALPPKPGALVSVVLNPRGPEPAFETKVDFIPVDTVKREYDRHASMIIIDARPPSDYARMHVAGSISVPFYSVAEFARQIPKERYILTYCGCPHAESGKVRDALRSLGYPRVAVMDEGMFAWRDRGYPVRGGAHP